MSELQSYKVVPKSSRKTIVGNVATRPWTAGCWQRIAEAMGLRLWCCGYGTVVWRWGYSAELMALRLWRRGYGLEEAMALGLWRPGALKLRLLDEKMHKLANLEQICKFTDAKSCKFANLEQICKCAICHLLILHRSRFAGLPMCKFAIS